MEYFLKRTGSFQLLLRKYQDIFVDITYLFLNVCDITIYIYVF